MKYNPALDGIRALAVLAVMAGHVEIPGMYQGMWGVDVFFVLSGFLITTLLMREAQATGTIRFGQFYLRRIRRLYPALLTMLVLYLAAFPWIRPEGHQLRDALFAATYVTDYTMAFLREAPFWHTDMTIGHTWSLSVEEHFYLLWPLVVIGLSRIRTRRYVLYLLAAAYLASTFWRLWSHVEIGWAETYYRFDTRTSGLVLGSALALAPPIKHRAWAVLAAPVLVYYTWHWTDWSIPRSIPTLPAEWLGVALVLWATSGKAKLLEWKPLVYVGSISYGLYLYHWPIAWALREAGLAWWQTFPLTFVASFLIAHGSAKYIEAPFRSVRRVESATDQAHEGPQGAGVLADLR